MIQYSAIGVCRKTYPSKADIVLVDREGLRLCYNSGVVNANTEDGLTLLATYFKVDMADMFC